jgi:hypothetical protein
LPHFPKYVGHCILGVGAVMQDPFTQREKLGSEAVVERAKRPTVAAANRGKQLRIVRQGR